jgi:two-component system, cell cycle sensor histidine kinase and response regulator CckA
MSAPEASILVVEDDLGLAELIREAFAERGWACVHCGTGAAAAAWLEDHQPSLALLDYSLPDMTGAELIERTPIRHFIVTTGAGDERVAVAMMKRGALDYLVKDGMFLETLPEVVERALRHISTEQRLAEAEINLRLVEEDLVRARKMESLGLMAGGIAHDFNNLFQGIQGNLELARIKAADAALQAPLDRALKILDKASLLTHRMLEFSGKGFRRSEALALNALVRECLRPFMDLGEPRIQFSGQAGLPRVEGDAKQLTQVLTGLVLNAKESLGARGGSIQVRAELRLGEAIDAAGVWIHPAPPGPAAVCLVVEDNGSGMSREVLERAFDPFFTTHRPGRGLGLSAALGILRTHNAGLWVDTVEGRGTIFRIHFPPCPEDGPRDLAAAPTEPCVERKTILLVDDDEDLQETLAEFLRDDLGYPVLQARDGLEAVELYRRERERIGLVLMDSTMPRLSGPDALQAILAFAPEVRAILCSGGSEETWRAAGATGFQGYLKKPFLLKTLQETLVRVMGN